MVRWKWISYGIGWFLVATLVWVIPKIVAAQSPGEKNLGAGLLFVVALVMSPVCGLLGIVYLVATLLEYRIQRSLNRQITRLP